MEQTGGLEAMLNLLLLIQLCSLGAFWKLSSRVGMNKIVFVLLTIIPGFGWLVIFYIYGKGMILILDRLDEIQPKDAVFT